MNTDENATFLVHGTVTDPEGRAARGLTVVAFDQDLRKRQELGTAKTGKDGTYEIAYGPELFQQAEKESADLVIEVRAESEVLHTSSVRFNASPHELIDISLARLSSEAEFDRIARELALLLVGQEVSLETFEENSQHRDVSFAAGETGIPKEWLQAFAVAQRLPGLMKVENRLEPQFWFAAFRAHAFLLGHSEPAPGIEKLAKRVLDKVPRKPWPDLAKALEWAFERKVIADGFKRSLPDWKKKYDALTAASASARAETEPVLDEATSPTGLFARDLARAMEEPEAAALLPSSKPSPETRPALLYARAILDFLQARPDFELGTTSLAAIEGEFMAELRAVQRVFKLAPSFAATNTLLADGVHSANAIYQMGQTQFVRSYAGRPGFDEQTARETYQRAANTYAAVVTIVGDLRATQNANDVLGLANEVEALVKLPDLAGLFGKADLCECEHCRSIFSPAAYLADLLMFLKARKAVDGKPVKDVLFKRRPDLGTIELSCDNSNTPLPYVDLACELLEERVAPTGTARQTHGTAEERAAYPEYVNDSAYQTLSQADRNGPLTLPFELYTEEARAYLGLAGIHRSDLMSVLQRAADPTKPSPAIPEEKDIAAELLGISKAEQDLIFQEGEADVPSPFTVDAFLTRTGLEYTDLQRLLSLGFANPGGAIEIEHLDASCDTSQKNLQGLDRKSLDRIYRFLRLWRKLGWSMWEVDLVIQQDGLGRKKLDENLAKLLRPFLQLEERLALPVDQLCALFGNIDTAPKFTTAFHATEPPLYERLFLDRRVTNPPDPAFAVTEVTRAKEPPPFEKIDDHLPPILGALRLDAAGLAVLRGLTINGKGIDGRLSLENLSFLDRHALVAQLLRIPAAEWKALLRLAGTDPFSGPAATLAFVELVEQIRASGFTIDQLSYVLRADLSAGAAETEANVIEVLTALRDALQAADKRLRRDVVIQQLSAALRLTPSVAEKLLTGIKLFGAPEHPLLEEYTADAFAVSTGRVTRAAFQNQYDGYYWLHRTAIVCLALAVTSEDVDWMLNNPAGKGILDVKALPVSSGAASIAPLLQLGDFLRLHRAVSKPALSLFAVVDRLLAVTGSYKDAGELAADVEKLIGRSQADVKAVIELEGPTETRRLAAYQKIAAWQRLQKAIALLERLGGDAKSVLPLAAATVGAPESAALKRMLRSKYSERQWLDLSKNIQNALRERKRDSLVAYLLMQPRPADAPSDTWRDPDDLYAYNLIDVQMCSCQLTSRIVQASAAVQLFVQRCFLGLEPQVRASAEKDDNWNQWAWMKNYRVWEANRRVFAYPENYAEPGLRRDKSELFAALEDELLQGELNRDNVETAFLHYVERLDEVAQLEVAGTYYQESNQTLHVFGRTAGSDPRIHYHRKLVGERRWTAWSKVESDIRSDYVVPLVHNERLCLVWPEFREEPVLPGKMTVPAPGADVRLEEPSRRLQIFLAATEQKNGKWMPKKLTQDHVQFPQTDRTAYTIVPLDFTWWAPSPTARPSGPFLLYIYGGNDFEGMFDLAGCRGCPELFTASLYPHPFEIFPRFEPLFASFSRDARRLQKNVEIHEGDPLVGYRIPDDLEILDRTPGRFKITYPHYMSWFDRELFERFGAGEQPMVLTLGTFYSWFYADKQRTFFVRPKIVNADGTQLFYKDVSGRMTYDMLMVEFGAERLQLEVSSFYHPLTCRFARALSARGIEGLLARETQFADTGFDFPRVYEPRPVVDPVLFPRENVDFSPDGSYSIYNWELFYFAPLMIADRLSKDQRFEEAMRWFHLIFDPTGAHDQDPVTGRPAPVPQKYWITKPFYLRQDPEYLRQRIENLLRLLANDPKNPTPPSVLAELIRQVEDWRDNPFDPHLVAQFRTVAYQKLTVMKYIENLIAWGDQRFRADTLESVNEAAQLYVLAAEILGPRPRRVPPAGQPEMETFNELESALDAFSNAIVALENLVPSMPAGEGGSRTLAPLPGLYFCIPQNDQLLRLWDTVADRLYKIRHCLDIEGVARQLALFAPPIDPLLLVRAAAAGVDIASALTDLEASLPPYRFTIMVQKANELVSDVKSLGAALLSALEKKDAEALALLRQSQETAVLQAVRDVRQRQIEDAQCALEAAHKNLETVDYRRNYYRTRQLISPTEMAAVILSAIALANQFGAVGAELLGAILSAIPDFDAGIRGVGGSPSAGTTTGGISLSTALDLGAKAMVLTTGLLDRGASLATTQAGYERRWDDWQMQLGVAEREMEQIKKQIASAEVRLAIAQRELANHDLQIVNARALDDFMRGKYTNRELYQWMIGQISQTYFQSYQLAYDLARRAEQCVRYELGDEKVSLIRFGSWDNLHKGLLAGERLQLDLRRLESAYLDRNRRELECTKHVSLALLDPRALLELKDKGTCSFDVPEELFNLDFPGHYFRRIKSVSLSIPCVAGPQTTVSCSLRLTANRVRIETTAASAADYPYKGISDTRFRESRVPVTSIATSSGQNDSGLFELSFRDERYLPFEGAGAISSWQVELVEERKLRQLDYQTISDVILHIRYTAREDGNLKGKATEYLKEVITSAASKMPLRRLFDLKHEFPTEWYAFFHPAGGAQKVLRLPVLKRHFPVFAQEGAIRIKAVYLLARVTGADLFAKLPFKPDAIQLARPSGGLFHVGDQSGLDVPLDESRPWELRLGKSATNFEELTFDDVKEGYLVVQYTL